jgi:hypothetical protein
VYASHQQQPYGQEDHVEHGDGAPVGSHERPLHAACQVRTYTRQLCVRYTHTRTHARLHAGGPLDGTGSPRGVHAVLRPSESAHAMPYPKKRKKERPTPVQARATEALPKEERAESPDSVEEGQALRQRGLQRATALRCAAQRLMWDGVAGTDEARAHVIPAFWLTEKGLPGSSGFIHQRRWSLDDTASMRHVPRLNRTTTHIHVPATLQDTAYV